MKKLYLESIALIPLIQYMAYISNRKLIVYLLFEKIPAFYSLIVIVGLFYTINIFLIVEYEKIFNIKTMYVRKILIYLCFLILMIQPIEFPIIMSNL